MKAQLGRSWDYPIKTIQSPSKQIIRLFARIQTDVHSTNNYIF